MKYTIFAKQDFNKNKSALTPGNFVVTHGNDFFDTLIHIFTMSYWNHAALIVETNGTLIELTTGGIRKKNIADYPPKDIHIVAIDMSNEDRKQVREFAEVMLKRHPTYGFLTIASIALKIMTMSRLVIKLDGTLICSEFVARALAQGGIIWDKDPSLITPADLYTTFIKLRT